MLIAGLSTGHKIGLGLVALAFIAFALSSSFLLPRLRPQFPGKGGVAGFVAVTVLFFCAMMSAVWFFGKEPKEAKAGGAATTQAQATSSAASTTTAAPAVPRGDPAAGKRLFAANGCGACHTYKPAGASATVGPDLDKLAAYATKANQPLDKFAHDAIVSPPASYVPPGFPTNVMPTNFGTTLSPKQIADLVVFVTQGH